MTVADDEFPPATTAEYVLRFTLRALDDLACSQVTPGDLGGVEASTHQKTIVKSFADLRGREPTGSGGALHSVGRPDIYALHGPDGSRACTWYDTETGICWFLGWVAQHDYAEFETRALNGELLPSVDDEFVWERELEHFEFDRVIAPGFTAMVEEADAYPDAPVRRTVGNLVKLDICVQKLELDGVSLAELYITITYPLVGDKPAGWPSADLLEVLAETATGSPRDALDLSYPDKIPGADHKLRDLNFEREAAIRINSWGPLP